MGTPVPTEYRRYAAEIGRLLPYRGLTPTAIWLRRCAAKKAWPQTPPTLRRSMS